VGPPVNGAILPCGNIDPSGITGTPVIDTRLGVLAFVSLTTSNGTLAGIRSLAWALSVLDGTVLPGWPVDIQAALTAQVRLRVGEVGWAWIRVGRCLISMALRGPPF
jgi:hypothetical protein